MAIYVPTEREASSPASEECCPQGSNPQGSNPQGSKERAKAQGLPMRGRLPQVGPWRSGPLVSVHAELIAVQEAERRRIARELHDVVGQALTAVKLSLQSLERAPEAPGHECTAISESIATVDSVLQQVRAFAFDLRPAALDDLGLAAALRSHCARTARQSGLAITYRLEAGETRFGADTETTCFRVAQEAITNVIRHAGASRVWVKLRVGRRPAALILEVRDNGVGFDTLICGSARCIGIEGMRERAILAGGSLEVISSPGAGTRIIARLPIDDPEPRS
jgi:signal transduction histidine kinase